MITSPKATAAAGLPDESKGDALARPGNMNTAAHPARRCP